jgi:hypothetical protein
VLKVEAFLDNVPAILTKLDAIEPDKWPRILADAANETGYYVLNKYKSELPKIFDAPVPFTINSMRLNKATPQRLEAEVGWKSGLGLNISAEQYLMAEVTGGNRHLKRFEKALQAAGLMPKGYVAVPTKDAPMDVYGNVPGNFIVSMLSYLRANPEAQQNRRVDKYKRQSTASFIKGFAKTALNRDKVAKREASAKAKGSKFFSVKTKGERGNLSPGIYERINQVSIGGKVYTKAVFLFAPVATYKPRFPFQEIGQAAAKLKFEGKLDEAIQKALAAKGADSAAT